LKEARRRELFVFREYFESIIVAIVIALILRAFVISAYKIPTSSMAPTLKVGDAIFAWKLPYGVRIPFTKSVIFKPRTPNRGDVVVFRYPEDESLSFVKRVIALPGDKIQIRQKRVFINDQMLSYSPVEKSEEGDEYIVQKELLGDHAHLVMFKRGEDDDAFGPVVIPNDKIFVLGDNRDSSDDSRAFGMVPIDNLEGKAVLIWVSLDWHGQTRSNKFPGVRADRIFSRIR
jgi:signal peptidase I